MSSLRPEGSRRKVMSEINVVPYIDVMLVLVVILMVSAPFVEPSVVNLPTVAKASKAPDKVISVVVQADGSLAIKDGAKLTPQDMPCLLYTSVRLRISAAAAADTRTQFESAASVRSAASRFRSVAVFASGVIPFR